MAVLTWVWNIATDHTLSTKVMIYIEIVGPIKGKTECIGFGRSETICSSTHGFKHADLRDFIHSWDIKICASKAIINIK